MNEGVLSKSVVSLVKDVTRHAGPVELDTPFMEVGVDSMLSAEFIGKLSSLVGATLSPTLIFDHPTPRAIVAHLLGTEAGNEQTANAKHTGRGLSVEPQDQVSSRREDSTRPDPPVTEQASLRLVMLHGEAADSSIMRLQMRACGWFDALADRVAFIFAEAPHACRANPALHAAMHARGLYDENATYCGWGMEPTTTYANADDDAAMVAQSVAHVEGELASHAPAQGIGGICDGALIAACVAARGGVSLEMFLNFCSSPWERLPSAQRMLATPVIAATSSLHLLGDADELCSAEELMRVPCSCRQAIILRHAGGHVVPPLTSGLARRVMEAFDALSASSAVVASPSHPATVPLGPFASTAQSPLAAALESLSATQRIAHVEQLVLRCIRDHAAGMGNLQVQELRGETPLTGTVPNALGVALQRAEADTNLLKAGLTSLDAVRIMSRISGDTGMRVPPTLILEHPTPRVVAEFLVHAATSGATCTPTDRPLAHTSAVSTLPTASPLRFAAGASADAQLPVSNLQYQLLLHQQMQPQSTAYNEPFSLIFEEVLPEPIARAALQWLVRRHALLRTYYTLDLHASTFHHVVLPADGFVVPLSCCREGALWHEQIERELDMPFDLFAAPPLRAVMFQSSPSHLVVIAHHVAVDMEAMEIMRTELHAQIDALTAKRIPPQPPPLPMEYADFAIWDHARESDEEALAWWLEYLDGACDLLELPRPGERPRVQQSVAKAESVCLGEKLTSHLVSLSSHAGATLNNVLLTAWGALLQELSGQDVLVGLPHSTRCANEFRGQS